jgi:hypothetical protein
LGAGLSGIIYNVPNTMKGDEFSWSKWGIALGIGAATGLVFGAFTSGAGAIADFAADRGITSLGVGTLGRSALVTSLSTVGGAVSGFGGQMLSNVAAHADIWKGVIFATLVGGGIGLLGGAASSAITRCASRQVTIEEKYILGGIRDTEEYTQGGGTIVWREDGRVVVYPRELPGRFGRTVGPSSPFYLLGKVQTGLSVGLIAADVNINW